MHCKLTVFSLLFFERILFSESINDKFLSLESIKNPSIRDKIIVQIFENYKKHELPTEELLKPTIVIVNIHILAINSIDVINMAFNADFYLRQEWLDRRLAWTDQEAFRNFTRPISIPSMFNKLWLPDLFFRNGKEGFMYKMTMPNFLIRLKSDGEILYSQKITMRFSCQMHLSNFPMDSQQCEINIGSYGYTMDDLRFQWKTNESVTQSKDIQISEFYTPVEVLTMDCNLNSKTSTGTYSCLKLLFTLKRQLSSYLVSTYIPAILIVMVSWLSFWISVEAVPARVTLGLLTLLGILTQNKGVSGNLPRVSYIKAIDIYIIACILFIIGAFTEFAIASNYSRRRRNFLWDKNASKTVYDRIDPNRLKCNHNSKYESEKLNDEIFMGSEKLVLKKRKKKFCCTIPYVKTNSGKTCTVVSLDSTPRKTRINELRKQVKVIQNQHVTEEEELKRLLLNSHYNVNTVYSNDSNTGSKYYSIRDKFKNNFNKTENIFRMNSLNDKLNEDKTVDYNSCGDNIVMDSDLDSYSRFLFPAFFLLYNCFYWLYYLVIT